MKYAISTILIMMFVFYVACTEDITYTVVRLAWTQTNENGFGNPNNKAINSVVTYRSRNYAGTTNAIDGGQVWRFRGITPNWDQVNEDGFGDANNTEVRLWVIDNILYAGTRNENTGAEFWQYDNAAETWAQINTDGFGDADNTAILSLALSALDNIFVIGTENQVSGGQIWRFDSGTTWTKVLDNDGFGDADNSAINTLYYNYFDDNYYAGTTNAVTGGEIWRSSDRTAWEQVNPDGFGDAGNTTIETIMFFSDLLLATTTNNAGGQLWQAIEDATWDNISEDGLGDTNNTTLIFGPVFIFGLQYLSIGTINQATGGEIWVSFDGIEWGQHNDDGFEDPNNISAVPHFLVDATMQPLTSTSSTLIASSANDADGVKVWYGVPTVMEVEN